MKISCTLSNFSWEETSSDSSVGIELDKVREHLSQRLQAQNLVILLGAGASRGVVIDPKNEGKKAPLVSDLLKELEKDVPDFLDIKQLIGIPDSNNFEEILSRCLLFQKLKPDDKVGRLIEKAKEKIVSGTNFLQQDSDLSVFETFLRCVTLRTGKSRPHIFSLNYDLALETAAAKMGFTLIDGFSFTYPHHFSPLHFDYDIVRRINDSLKPIEALLYFYKLHGSLNWTTADGLLTRGAGVSSNPTLIFPTAEKFQESYNQPFLEMITRFKESLRANRTTLVCIGYSCGDEHINSIVSNSLDINYDFNLVFVDPNIQNNKNYEKFINRGLVKDSRITFFEGTMEELVKTVPVLSQQTKEEAFVRSLLKVVNANVK